LLTWKNISKKGNNKKQRREIVEIKYKKIKGKIVKAARRNQKTRDKNRKGRGRQAHCLGETNRARLSM
jgi:type VI protein secretion system component Hcp